MVVSCNVKSTMKGNSSRHCSVERIDLSDYLDLREVSGEHKNMETGWNIAKGYLGQTEYISRLVVFFTNVK